MTTATTTHAWLKLARLATTISLVLLAGTAQAQYTHHAYLDIDNNPSTGCTVAVHEAGWSGNVTGIERDVQIAVSTTAPASVTGISVLSCTGAAFGTPQVVSAGSWPVGLNVGTGGGDVIEGYLPRTFVPAGATVRAYFHSQLNAANDVLLTTSGSGGSPMLFTLDAGAAPGAAAIPAMGAFGLSILGLAIAAAAFGLLRSRAGVVGALLLAVLAGAGVAGVAYAATITMNGQVGDWAGTSALGTDPTGDSSIGDAAEDIVAGFATFDATNIYFRVDVWNVECTPATSPTMSVTASGPTTFCEPGSVTLTAQPAGLAFYRWSSGQTTQSILVTTTGSYAVTGIDVNGCMSFSAPAVVTVNPLPSGTISANPTTINGGEQSTLSITVANGTSWTLTSSLGNAISPNTGTGNGTFSSTLTADNAPGTDTITLTITGPCGSSGPITTTVIVNP